MTEITDPAIEYIRKLVRSALRSTPYHEKQLKLAHANLAFAKELFRRADCDENIKHNDDVDNESFENSDEYARSRIDVHLWEISYHEEQLLEKSNELAFIKMLLARGNYTEIDVSEIERKILTEYDNG